MTGLITSILQREPETPQYRIRQPKTASDRDALTLVIQLGPLAKAKKLKNKDLRRFRHALKRCRDRGLIYVEG